MKKDKTFGFIGHATIGMTTLSELPRLDCPVVILIEEDFKAAKEIAVMEGKRFPVIENTHKPVVDNFAPQNQLQEILKMPKLDLILSPTRTMNRAERRAYLKKKK
jgi:hypothetical protein